MNVQEKLVLIASERDVALVIDTVSPSQDMGLCAWLNTDLCVRMSRPIITSYRDFRLLNSCILTLGILKNLQKSGKNIFFSTKYLELLYFPCVVVNKWEYAVFGSMNGGNERWLISVFVLPELKRQRVYKSALCLLRNCINTELSDK